VRFYVDGLRYQRSAGTRNRRLADRIGQRWKDQVIARRFQVVELDPYLTVGQLAERFLNSATSRPFHHQRLRLLLPYLAEGRVARLTRSQIEDYRLARRTSGGVRDATVNRDLSVLRRVLNWAVEEGLIPVNPLGRLRLPAERVEPRPVMSIPEEDALLAAVPPEFQNVIIAALDTGMRRGELLSQRWEHLDFTRELLFVSRSKTAAGEGREIPLTRRLSQILYAFRQDEGIVFGMRQNSISSIRRAWKAAVRRARLRHFRFHDLRHSFNTRLMEAGVMPDVRMALMGHTSGQQVHARYTHVGVHAKREAVARLEQWVDQQRRKEVLSQQKPIDQNQEGGERPQVRAQPLAAATPTLMEVHKTANRF
jgi:integrase